MPIKNNLSKIAKTVSGEAVNAASQVAKKSEDLLEVSKITLIIASKQDKINEIYNELGKRVFDMYNKEREIPEDSKLRSNCEKIIEIKNDIEVLNKQIKDIKKHKRV